MRRMSIKNTKLLTVTGVFRDDPITFLVETLKNPGEEAIISFETLDGVYESREDFEDALDYTVDRYGKGYAHKDDVKRWSLIYLKLLDAHRLVDALNEALAASEES